ncbi:MAG: cupin domain-containing protein [Thauera sp.]
MNPGIPAAARGNLLAALPSPAAGEIFQTLFDHPGCRIERIVSHGHASAAGDWYDQDADEWVVLLSGDAVLQFDGGDVARLKAGDWITIPAHCRHRVASTSPDAVWLAVHCCAGG